MSQNTQSGVELIAAERQEQIHKHGFDTQRDIEFYKNEELLSGAYAYMTGKYEHWPWGDMWKPTGDKIKDLAKAGAMIAGHIDLLLQMQLENKYKVVQKLFSAPDETIKDELTKSEADSLCEQMNALELDSMYRWYVVELING